MKHSEAKAAAQKKAVREWHKQAKEIVWSQKPHYHSGIDNEDEFYVFSARMLFDHGASNWRFGFGSTGV